MTPRSFLRVLVRTICLARLVSLSLTFAVSPGGTLATPKANRIRRGAFVDAASVAPRLVDDAALSRTSLFLTKKRIWLVHGVPRA